MPSVRTINMRESLLATFNDNKELDSIALKTISASNSLDKVISINEPELAIWLFNQFRKHRLPGGKDYKPEDYNEVYETPKMLEKIVVNSLLVMLKQIENREILAKPKCSPNEHVCEIEYELSNGWCIEVFSRVYRWHGVYGYTTPKGIYFDPSYISDSAELINHDVSEIIEREIYGFKF